MLEEKKSIDNPSENIINENIINENVTYENNDPKKPGYGGSLFERRFMIYDKMKIPVKVIDAIIIISVILLFIFFILGASIK